MRMQTHRPYAALTAISLLAVLQCRTVQAANTILRTLVYHDITDPPSATVPQIERGYGAYPIMSDNGNMAAFTYTTSDRISHVGVINTDGSGQREIYATANGHQNLDISADGSKVLMWTSRGLRIADAGGVRSLIEFEGVETAFAVLSGDGSKAFFSSHRGDVILGTSTQLPAGVWVINTDGTGLRQVLSAGAVILATGAASTDGIMFGFGSDTLDVSADGSRIICAATNYNQGQSYQFTMNLDGSGLRVLNGPGIYIGRGTISADGAKVAFHIRPDGGAPYIGVANFDGSGRVILDPAASSPTFSTGHGICLSGDGSMILLAESSRLMRTNGSNVVQLLVPAGGFGLTDTMWYPSMNLSATRFLYMSNDYWPTPLSVMDLNPASLGSAPTISAMAINPPYVLTGGRSDATVTASVRPAPDLNVCPTFLRNGLQDNSIHNSYYGGVYDDGSHGDARAGDGVFTNNTLNAGSDAVVGPRTVRMRAEIKLSNGRRHATAVDFQPFAVVDRLGAPVISSFTPASGRIGTIVTIAGVNFTGATAVKFDGVNATNFNVDDITQITATVPNGATTGRITVVTPSGTASSATNFTVVLPSIGGRVTRSTGVGLAGVRITRSGSGTPLSVLTDSLGNYLLAPVPAGTYTVTPSLSGYAFNPASATATVTDTVNATNINFQAAPVLPRYTISGTITRSAITAPGQTAVLSGAPVLLAKTSDLPALAAAAANPSLLTSLAAYVSLTRTGTMGGYSFSVTPGTYLLTTYLPGSFFTPTYRTVSVTTASVPGQNFALTGTDTVVPTVTIGTPTATIVPGTATDSAKGSSGILTVLVTLQDSGNRYLNWSSSTVQFTTAPLVGSYKVAILPLYQSRVPFTNWAVALPAALPGGTYRLTARAVDRAFKVSTAVVRSIVKAPHSVALASPVTLSGATASAATGSVQLRFSGPLAADAASDSSHYAVTVNGQPVAVEAAGYNAATHVVTLTVADGALRTGDQITVTWHDVLDTDAATGTAGPLTVR